MALYNSIHELIGHTPLVKLGPTNEGSKATIYAKLEQFNPSGSVKDRVGKYMIKDAEDKGLLKPGYTIIEATAGNTGLGIAFAALGKGYRIIFVVPTKFSIEKQQLMMALGAEIISTPREKGMLGAEEKAEELLKTIPNSISLRQFRNMSNPLAHYETTGPEIYEDLSGKIDYVVLGAGSGGTFTGTVKYLKGKLPGLTAVLADPVGSTIGGGEHADYEMSVIEKICDRVAIIDNGKVAEIGDVGEIFARPRSEAAKTLLLPGLTGDNPFSMSTKRCYRIVFDGRSATEPVIANLVKATGESVNILSANTRSVGGIGYGQMIVEFPEDAWAHQVVEAYFKKIGIEPMEVKEAGV